MIYKNFADKKLSALGLGCMRLPTSEDKSINMAAAREMVAYAMKNGINYYDTAWGYHEGKSETVMGEILADYPRESFYLATKFPGYDVSNMEKVEEIFEKQLEKCGVEYFDFYLFHNLSERNVDLYLDPKFGILDYLLRQKANGRIRHLGFSAHGTLATMRKFLEAYGEHMEFCQIQLNWLDWTLQSAKEKVDLLREYHLPIWVMEPVRGGALAKFAPEYEERMKALKPDATAVEWAFRFLQTVPDVVVTLSGMSNMDQLQENVATFSEEKPLSESEKDALLGVARDMTEKTTLPCTACRYCTTYCPQGLDIPRIIELYNELSCSGGLFLVSLAVGGLPKGKKPADCIGCRACEEVCPQNIKISDMMRDFAEKLKK